MLYCNFFSDKLCWSCLYILGHYSLLHHPETKDLILRFCGLLKGSLTHPELLVAVEMLSSVVLINGALDVGDRAASVETAGQPRHEA